MTDVTIKKTESLSGEVCAPPSKSYTQRMLIAAALSNGSPKYLTRLFQKIPKQHCELSQLWVRNSNG